MGADIHSFAERKRNGKWEMVEEKVFGCESEWPGKGASPFDWRSYSVFGFLADVRKYSHVPVLVEPRGLPEDSEFLNQIVDDGWAGWGPNGCTIREDNLRNMNYHSHSYITLRELLDFDYEQTFEDRRYTKVTTFPGGGQRIDGAAEANEGEGEITTFREFLGEGFFDDIAVLQTLGEPDDVRIVFWFDN